MNSKTNIQIFVRFITWLNFLPSAIILAGCQKQESMTRQKTNEAKPHNPALLETEKKYPFLIIQEAVNDSDAQNHILRLEISSLEKDPKFQKPAKVLAKYLDIKVADSVGQWAARFYEEPKTGYTKFRKHFSLVHEQGNTYRLTLSKGTFVPSKACLQRIVFSCNRTIQNLHFKSLKQIESDTRTWLKITETIKPIYVELLLSSKALMVQKSDALIANNRQLAQKLEAEYDEIESQLKPIAKELNRSLSASQEIELMDVSETSREPFQIQVLESSIDLTPDKE